jgi:hypothetical protein
MHDDAARLPHPVRTGNGLVFCRRFPLRFHQDHYRGSLEIEADSASLNLTREESEARSFLKLVNNTQSLSGRYTPSNDSFGTKAASHRF